MLNMITDRCLRRFKRRETVADDDAALLAWLEGELPAVATWRNYVPFLTAEQIKVLEATEACERHPRGAERHRIGLIMAATMYVADLDRYDPDDIDYDEHEAAVQEAASVNALGGWSFIRSALAALRVNRGV